MKRVLLTALATAAIGITAAPASATTTLCTNGSGCLTNETNVNLVQASGVTTVQGDINGTAIDVAITGTGVNGSNLLDADHGQASVSMTDTTTSINSITFALLNGTFGSAEFNLLSGGKTPFTVSACTSDGNCDSIALSDPQGSNWFDIIAPTGTVYTSANITAASGFGFTDFKQLRFDNFAAVPEPATWAMMLLGFGGIGIAMRRRRRNAALMQIA